MSTVALSKKTETVLISWQKDQIKESAVGERIGVMRSEVNRIMYISRRYDHNNEDI